LEGYIREDIAQLNAMRFKNNSASYKSLQSALRFLEATSSIIIIINIAVSIGVMTILTRGIVTPLANLANTARLVGKGDFKLRVETVRSRDEIGIVTQTFNKMVESLDMYVDEIRAAASMEQELRENQLTTESLLREAQLRFYQSQINPHFLFNCLNAGVQLASMEDAEKTSVFLEHMAEFFRYNVIKSREDASIREEIQLVENYIYILNVRFAGEIRYSSEIDQSLLDIRVPGMILQPLVENSIKHGISGLNRPGEVKLALSRDEKRVKLSVRDNGVGISAARLAEINEQILGMSAANAQNPDIYSAGVGLDNVAARLRLYFGQDHVCSIENSDTGSGVIVTLFLPV